MISELFLPDLKIIKDRGTLADQNDFFTAMYIRQESWKMNYKPDKFLGEISPDRNVGQIKEYAFPMEPRSWLEFQEFFDFAYGFTLWLEGWRTNLNTRTFNFYLTRAGLYRRTPGLTTLTASDGIVLATNLVTYQQWQTGWNTLRVPYERGTLRDPIFPYLKSLAPTGENDAYFRQSRYNIG